MRAPEDLLAAAEDGVRLATREGADHVEVYVWHSVIHSGKQAPRYREVHERDGGGVGVRVARGGHLAAATAGGIDERAIAWAVREALGTSQYMPSDPAFRSFATPASKSTRPLAPVPPELESPDPARLIAVLEGLAEGATRVAETEFYDAAVATRHGVFAVANSSGLAATDRNAYEACSIEVRTRGAASPRFASARRFGRAPIGALVDLPALGEDVARLAVASGKGRAPLPHGVRDVILDAYAAADVIHNLSPSFAGSAGQEGRSRLSGMLGKEAASDSLTLTDRPWAPAACRVQRVDDEGVPTHETTTILERGVLRTYLYTWPMSVDLAAEPRGHGLRPLTGRHARTPAARPANLEVEPGERTLDEMVAEADEAVLVRAPFMGSFTINPVTGDLSVVAPLAWYVKGGRLRHPLANVALGGNLFDAIRNLRAVGREVARVPGGTTVPLQVAGLTCAT